MKIIYSPPKVNKSHPYFRIDGIQINVGSNDIPDKDWNKIAKLDYVVALIDKKAIIVESEPKTETKPKRKSNNAIAVETTEQTVI